MGEFSTVMETRDEVEGFHNCLEFSTVMKTLDFVSGFHNCREFSHPLECLYQAMHIQEIRACAWKAKHHDVTTMFTYCHANMPLGQSEHAYYLSYFTKVDESVGAPQRGTNMAAGSFATNGRIHTSCSS